MKGCLLTIATIIVLIALAIYVALPHPIHDRAQLKEIASESEHLLATYPLSPTTQEVEIPKRKWPPAIAKLNPFSVTVRRRMVDIWIRPSFDGGWGYGFARDRRDLTMVVECWSALDNHVYWHGPC